MRYALRPIERAWRRLLLRIVARFAPRPSTSGPPSWGARPHRVLYLRPDRIGDMIMATGLLRAISTSHRTLTLDVLASPANAVVLAGNPAVHHVEIFHKRRPWTYPGLLWRLRQARYDAVIDGMVQAPSVTGILLMLASGAPHRIGIDGRGVERIVTIPVPPEHGARHYIDRSSALIAAFGGSARTSDFRPAIYLSAAEVAVGEATWHAHDASVGCRILVNISAGRPSRRWPAEHFVGTLRHVRARWPAMQPVVVYAPSDVRDARAIAERSGVPFVETAGVRHVFALVATADYVLTPDTAIVHAASAFAKPVTVLYPRGKEAMYAPYATDAWPVVAPEQTLASLPLSPVLDAVDAMLAPVTLARSALS